MPLYLKDKLVSGTGAPGRSAYEAAKAGGYAGAEASFNQALNNVPGHIADTENPHGVTAAQVDAYSKSESDTLLANKAPAGYGLGEYTPTLISDCNTMRNGWYRVNASTANIPSNVGLSDGVLMIDEANSDLNFQSLYFYSNGYTYEMKRRHVDGVWYPWEWVDPPMVSGIEYRTTERHDGNPVYKKMDSDGVIWWSTDQSTWKREAERVGAYSKTETDSLLQNKLTNPGWFYGIYVAKTGSDTSGDGSESKPYLTIQHAIDVAPRTPTCLRIYIGGGTYNENIKIKDFTSIEIAPQDANNPMVVNSIEIDRCGYCYLEDFNVIGVYEETYRASIFATSSSVILNRITCTGNDQSGSPYGGGFRFQDSRAKISNSTISNKYIAISAVGSIVYLNNNVTGTGNTTALRCGDGYGGIPAIIMKGESTVSGAESIGYGGKIW